MGRKGGTILKFGGRLEDIKIYSLRIFWLHIPLHSYVKAVVNMAFPGREIKWATWSKEWFWKERGYGSEIRGRFRGG